MDPFTPPSGCRGIALPHSRWKRTLALEADALEADIHFANPSARRKFTEEPITSIETLARKYDEPEAKGARSHHLLIGACPTPKHRKPHHE